MKHFFATLWAVFLCLVSFAQNTPLVDLQFASQETKLIGPSPTASGMTRYADCPVSYGVGLAQVSIPLYQIQSQTLSLPITLSYDGSGVRVDAVSGVVGLNWTLEAGGVISRTVVGIPDDGVDGWDNDNPVYTRDPVPIYPYTLNTFDEIASGEMDSGRDIYSYNFCGYSGSFYINGNTFVPTTATDLQLLGYADGGFMVIDPSGTRYIFQEQERTSHTTKMSLPILGAGQGNTEMSPESRNPVTAWYLTRIVSLDGKDTIDFTYETLDTFSTETRSYVRSYSFTYKYNGPGDYIWLNDQGQWYGAPSVQGQLGSYETRNVWTPHVIKTITYNGGSVEFSYVTSSIATDLTGYRRSYPKILSSMSVRSPQSGGGTSTDRSVTFTMGTTGDSRHLLKGVSVTGRGGATVESYSLSYYDESTNMGRDSKDLMGYYNGKMNTYLSFLRLFEDNYTFNNEPVADRSYNASAVKSLSLESVSTGSGSRTKFMYEENSIPTAGWSDLFTEIGIGQRIRRIITYDLSAGESETMVRVRDFTYRNPQITIPLHAFNRRSFVTVSEVFREDMTPYHPWWMGPTYPIVRTCTVTFNDQSVLPGAQLESARIFYGQVDERVTDPNGTGFLTEYEYDTSAASNDASNGQWSLDNSHDWHDSEYHQQYAHVYHFFQRPPYQVPRNTASPSVDFTPCFFHFNQKDRPQMTAPVEVRRYKRVGGQDVLVSRTTNQYATSTANLRVGWRVKNMIATGNETCMKDTLCAMDLYRDEVVHTRIWHRLIGSTETEYLDDGSPREVATTNTYIFGSSSTVPAAGSILSPLIVEQVVDGDTTRRYTRINRYPNMYPSDSTLTMMLYVQGYRRPLSEIQTYPSAESTTKSQTWKLFTPASWTGASGGTQILKPSRIDIFRGSMNVGPSKEYTVYDEYGNPLEVREEGQPVKTYVWGYGHLRPIAEIVGASFDEVRSALTAPQRQALDNFSSSPTFSFSQQQFFRYVLRPALHDAQVSLYLYDLPFGISSVEDPSGRRTDYSYDGAGRLVSVKDEDGNLVEGHLYELIRGGTGAPNRITSVTYTEAGATTLPETFSSCMSSSVTAVKDVMYLDGLGRPVQSVAVGASSQGRDLVTPYAPDFLDREDAKTYLPYPATTSAANAGAFRAEALSSQQAYYGFGVRAYGENGYELSARKRVTATSLAGFTEQTVLSTAGSPADYLPVLVFNPSNQTLSSTGYYAAGRFTVSVTEGPDGSRAESWTDEFGTPVLERVRVCPVQGSTPAEWSETRYVKDTRGRVVCVIPPVEYDILSSEAAQNGGQVASFDAEHCYTYSYDGRDRVTCRHLPDRPMETVTYNGADLPTLTVRTWTEGSGIVAEKFGTEYDGFNRPVRETFQRVTGVAPQAVQGPLVTLAEYAYDIYPSTMGSGQNTMSIPAFVPATGVAAASDKNTRTKGLKTAERIRILQPEESSATMEDDAGAQYLVRAFYYDKKSNVIQTAETRQDVGISLYSSAKYGFSGNVEKTHEGRYTPSGGSTQNYILEGTRTYDAFLRPTEVTARFVADSALTTAGTLSYTYDELGRQSTLVRGVGTTASTTSYTYTLQSWLASATSVFYSETLRYQSPSRNATDALPGKAGLVTEWTTWQRGMASIGGTAQSDTYAFTYDGAGRLTGSVRYEGESQSPLTTLTERDMLYRPDGSLLGIRRYGATSGTTPTDSLSFTYTGTKRTGYSYDIHGNVATDPVNGTTLTWNILGLPRTIADSTGTTRRVYAADGTLLATYEGQSGTEGRVYNGCWVLNRSATGAISGESAGWEGGRILPGVGGDKVLYYETDHLGSVRVIRDGAGTVRQRFDYYPFGSVSRNWTNMSETGDLSLRYRFGGKEIAGHQLSASSPAGTPAAAAGSPYLDFGARLYDPRTTAWLSHDPMSEKYYSISPYVYCADNPVLFFDADGCDLILVGANNSSITFTTDLLDLSLDVGWLGIDWLGNHVLDGKETLSAALDFAGLFDPTGVADGANAVLLASGGDYWGALQSGLSVLPLGDLAKAPRIGKDLRVIYNALDLKPSGYLHRPYIRKWVRDAVESKTKRDEFGRFLDVHKRTPIEGKYDLGHTHGNEFWRWKAEAEAEGLSQREFNDMMNDPSLYQIEDPHLNRSRKYEKKD